MSLISLPEKVMDTMYEQDGFSQWLGIEKIHIDFGQCSLKLTVRKEMLNGFHIAHGGITYSLADSAFAFASNSYGKKSVSIHTSIQHLKAVVEGDVLTAIASEQNRSNKLASYEIIINNQENQRVAIFHGMVFIKDQEWEFE